MLDHDALLRACGGHVPSHADEAHRPEVAIAAEAEGLLKPGISIPELFTTVWPSLTTAHIAVRLSTEPFDAMVGDLKADLLARGWYWRDCPSGRRWFPAEFDSSSWTPTEEDTDDHAPTDTPTGTHEADSRTNPGP